MRPSKLFVIVYVLYKTMTGCLYFDDLKFNIFDAIVFSAWWEEASQLMLKGAHRRGTVSPRGSSTSSCPTYGRFRHLMETVPLVPLNQMSFPTPSTTWSQENPWD